MIWQALQWLRHPYAYFQGSGRPPGLTWRAWLPGLGQVLMTGDPAMLSDIMHHPQLSGGKAHRALRATLGDDHLIVMSGPGHRARSSAVRQSLTAFTPDVEVARLTRQQMTAQPLGTTFSLYRWAHRVSLKVILSGLLGVEEDAALLKLARAYQSSFSSPLLLFVPFLQRDWGPWSPWGRLVRRRERLQRALLERLSRAPASSIGARLAGRIPMRDLATELLALLIFGHETTAATFAWCFTQLTPDAIHQIRRGDEEYTLAFVEESLRLCPVVGQLTRVAEGDLDIQGWSVPAGSVVMPAIPLAHRQFPDPDRFCPQRFLDPTPPLRHYCPFGFGDRICPGKAMALRQLVVMLQTLVTEFEVRLKPGYQPRPQRQLFLVVPHGGTPAVRLA